ncbi:MAG: gliding motility-associated C-terminal domain-containing protein [Bacteroidetes bacterium]|nr:gliding motility-associated C-terminal domain-containing protein [Bacteroidota bacterium]
MYRLLAGCLFLLLGFQTNTAVAQCPITVSAGADIVRCSSPGTAQLSGSITGNYLSFSWSPTAGMTGANTLTPTVNPTTTTNYILTATALDASTNLIANGDFESGTAGFTSDYLLNPGDLWPEGVYDVLTNPNAAHPNFPGCTDHTTGSGNMMAVNGSGTAGVDVWCQTVTVSPNTQYVFTAWATALVPASPARLQFSINGTTIGSIFNLSSTTCNWQNFYAVWNSGASTSATICIVNQNTAPSGNDFALDDIVFSPTCRVSDTVRVEVINLKAMAAAAIVTLPCQGASATLSGTGSSVGPGIMYQWTTPDGNIVSGANTLNPVVNSPGSYTLRVWYETASGVICEKFTTVNVFYNTNPLTAIIVPPQQLGCGAATVTLVGNATPSVVNVQYQWSLVTTGHIVGSTTNKNCVVNQPGLYQLIVTNTVTGCTSTAQMPVTADSALPVANASSDTINCIQSTAVLSGAGSSVGPGITYAWTTPNGSIVSSPNSISSEAGTPGTYILAVTNLANGCVVKDTVVVISNKVLPYASIDVPPAIDCDSDTVPLFVHLSPPPFVLLVWTASNGGHIASGEYTPMPQVTSPGTYVLYTTDPINGCVSVDSTTVITNFTPPLAATLPPDSLTCQQTSVILSGTGSSTGFNYGYQWEAAPGGHIVQNDQTLNPEVNAPGLYTLTVLNYLNGCTATADVLVMADTNAVTAVANVTDTLDCSTLSTLLNSDGSSTGANFTYVWTTTGGNFLQGADTPTPLVSAPGVYELTMTNTGNGCSATSSVTVLQDIEAPQVQIAPVNELTCAIPTQTVTSSPLQPSTTYSYTWSSASGNGISSPVHAPSITVNAAGTYQLLVSDSRNGCTAVFDANVSQEAGVPVVNALSTGPLTCTQTTRALSSTGSSVGNEYIYSWTALDGGHISMGETTASPVVDEPGQYMLQILNQDNGCIGFDTVAVIENIQAPAVEAGPGGELTCANTLIDLIGNENLPAANRMFQWSTVDGHFAVSPNGATSICDEPGVYYFQVVDTDNGCTSLDSLLVTQNKQAPAVNVAPPFPLTCAVTTVNLHVTASGSTAMTPLFLWHTSGGNIVSGDSTAQPLISAPGQYGLTVTDPANGCTTTGGAIVFQNTTPPPIDILPASVITCSSPSQSLQGQNTASGGSFSYSWMASGGGHISTGDTTLTPLIDAPGMYHMLATNLVNGCHATDSVQVQSNTTLPVVDAGMPDTLTCLSNSLTINGVASGQAILTYQWSVGNAGHIQSGNNTPNPVIDLPGIYILSVVDQANGCLAKDSVQIFQDANIPMAEAGQSALLTCQTTQTVLQGSASTGSQYSYQWSTTDGSIFSGATTLQPTVIAPGMYILAVKDNSNGCQRRDSVQVNENLTQPALTIATPGLLTCTSVQVQLSAQTPISGGTFAWTTPDGNFLSGNTSATPVVNMPGTYITTLTDPFNGCSSIDSTTVGSNTQTPVLSIQTPPILTCAFPTRTLNGIVSQPTGNFAVHWTTTGGTIDNGINTLQPVVSNPGTYQMNVLDQTNGCNAFVSVLVTENMTPPAAVATASMPITCDNPVITLSSAGSASGSQITYLWAGPDIDNGATTASPQVSGAGNYTITVTDLSNGCTAMATTLVSANTTPPTIVLAQPDLLTCTRQQVSIQTTGSSQGASYQASWSTTSNGHFVSGQNSWTPIIDEPATYTFTLENIANGCISTQSVVVSENTTIPGAAVAPAPPLHCNRTQISLAGSSNVANAAFSWNTVDGVIASGSGSAAPVVVAPGTYRVTVTNPLNGCTAIAQTTVSEVQAPDFLPVVFQPDCHLPTGAIDFGPVTGGLAPYRFSLDGGQNYASANSFEALSPGVYELIVQDDYGCTAVETREIIAPFQPSVALEALNVLLLGDSVSLQPVLNLPANNIASWEWSPSTGLSCADCPEPFARPLSNTAYTLIIKDLNGCVAQASTLLRVNTNRVLFPPNVISPDGDGKNDFFNLFGKGVQDVRWLRIYDRWGNQLYDVEHLPINDEMQGWNGSFRGQAVNPGVFVWQAQVTFIDGVTELFSGDVTVVR